MPRSAPAGGSNYWVSKIPSPFQELLGIYVGFRDWGSRYRLLGLEVMVLGLGCRV